MYSVITTNKDNSYMYSISSSDRNYLTKEECEEKFKEEMIKEITKTDEITITSNLYFDKKFFILLISLHLQ